MIPLGKKAVRVGSLPESEQRQVMTIRLSDDLVKLIATTPLQLCLDGNFGGHLITCDEQQRWIVNGMRETQPIDLGHYANGSLMIGGQVIAKLAIKQEMAQAKADSIRQHAEQAERDRTARRYK